MSNSPAARRKTSGDVIRKMQHAEKIQSAQRRRQTAGTGPVSFGVTSTTIGASGGFNPNINIDTGKLSVAGDVMMGAIAFNPQEKTITSNTLTISGLLIQPSSYIVVGGSGSYDLNTIAGAQFAGQLLILKAKTGVNVTLKHGVDNIHVPDGADFAINADYAVQLIFDNTLNKWVVVATFGGGTGGSGTEVFDWTAAHRANGHAFYLDTDSDTLIEGSTDDEISFHIGGTPDMIKMTNINFETKLEILPETTGGVGLGSSSKQFAATHSHTYSMWTDTTNDTTTTEAKIFRNSSRGLTFKSPTVGGSYGKHTFTDKDGADRIVFDYNASIKNAVFNYTTGGLKVRQNDSDTDGVLIYPRGNTFASSYNIIDSEGGNFSIRRYGVEKILIESSTITMKNDLDMDGEGIGNTINIAFTYGQDITSDGNGLDYKVPSGDEHEFYVAGTRVAKVIDLGLQVLGGRYIQPIGSSDEIGIMAKQPVGYLTIGSYGSILLPSISNTTSSPSSSTLDGWFGNKNGACGMQYNGSASAGSGKYRLWARFGSDWVRTEMY